MTKSDERPDVVALSRGEELRRAIAQEHARLARLDAVALRAMAVERVEGLDERFLRQVFRHCKLPRHSPGFDVQRLVIGRCREGIPASRRRA